MGRAPAGRRAELLRWGDREPGAGISVRRKGDQPAVGSESVSRGTPRAGFGRLVGSRAAGLAAAAAQSSPMGHRSALRGQWAAQT